MCKRTRAIEIIDKRKKADLIKWESRRPGHSIMAINHVLKSDSTTNKLSDTSALEEGSSATRLATLLGASFDEPTEARKASTLVKL